MSAQAEEMTVKAREVTSKILNLLLVKHGKDVCVPECKGGPTWGGSHDRMDLWTMARSWTRPRVCVYEIKATRADFMRDQKWMAYLAYCNEFYFAAAPGVLDVAEVPEQAGLVITSKNAARMYTKKKAPYRDVEVPETLYQYLLMSRSVIKRGGYSDEAPKSATDYWRRWLAEKDERKRIGYNVSRKIRELVSERIDRAKCDNHELQKRIGKLEQVEAFVETLGLKIHSFRLEEEIKAKLEEASTGVPKKIIDELDRVIATMEREKEWLTDRMEKL